MTLPAALFLLRCLIADTFRQALASWTFWLMASVSVVAIVFCLSLHVEGARSIKPPGEIELYGPDNKPYTGDNNQFGTITFGFGMFQARLYRDIPTVVAYIQMVLAFLVAGALGTLVALIWTGGFLPTFLEPSVASVLLTKPVSRSVLLFGKVLGVLTFVLFQAVLFFGGTWLALGISTSTWSLAYLLSIPLFLIHFSAVYSFSVLMAVGTRSTVTTIFAALAFWVICFGINYARHETLVLPVLDKKIPPLTTNTHRLIETAYWVMPKPIDLVFLQYKALDGDFHAPGMLHFNDVEKLGEFRPLWAVLTSFLFAAVMLLAAVWQFVLIDY